MAIELKRWRFHEDRTADKSSVPTTHGFSSFTGRGVTGRQHSLVTRMRILYPLNLKTSDCERVIFRKLCLVCVAAVTMSSLLQSHCRRRLHQCPRGHGELSPPFTASYRWPTVRGAFWSQYERVEHIYYTLPGHHHHHRSIDIALINTIISAFACEADGEQ